MVASGPLEASFATALVLVEPQAHVRPRWAVAFEARLVAMREILDLVYNFAKQKTNLGLSTWYQVLEYLAASSITETAHQLALN